MKRTPGPKILDCRIPIAMDRLEADWFESNLTAELPIFNQAAKIHPSSIPSKGYLLSENRFLKKKTSAPKTGPIKKQFLGSRTKAPHSWPQIWRMETEENSRSTPLSPSLFAMICPTWEKETHFIHLNILLKNAGKKMLIDSRHGCFL